MNAEIISVGTELLLGDILNEDSRFLSQELAAYGIQLLVPVLVLLVVMVLDYITGMTKAWNAGELSSRVGLWGILKKVGYLVIVGVACVVDWLLRYGADSLGWDWPVHPGERFGHRRTGAGLFAGPAEKAEGTHRGHGRGEPAGRGE